MDSSKQTGKKNLVVNGLPDHEYKKQHENNIRRVNNNAHAQGIQANGIEATNGSVTDARSHVSGSQNANGLSENHQLRVNGHVSDDTHIVISNRSVIVTQNNERQDNVSNGKIVGNNEKSNGTIQQREYTTRNVCELYRHENDVIFGRTRGGVLTENEVLVVDLDAESPVGTERQLARTLNGRQNSDEDDLRLDQSSSSSSHTAPLATPESFSDDEVVSTDCRENVDKKECKSTDGNTKHLVKKLKESIQNGHTDNNFCDQQDSDAFDVNFCNDEPLANDEMLPETTDKSENISNVDSIESLTVNESDGEEVGPENVEIPDNNQDIIEENILLEVLTEDVKSETSSNEGDGNFVDGIEEDLAMSDTGEGSEGSENNIDEGVCNVDNGELNDAPVGLLFDEEQAENDNNNDDLGDFIEADLPPNVERLAFFSRDSSSEEDEGCGDEVRPNNDEDVVSENETIDPTERDYMAPVHKVLNNSYEDGEHGSGNILSNREDCVRAELSNFYPCNITCDKSSEENDLDEDIDQTFMESQGAEGCSVVECSGCSMHNQASSFNRDKVSSSGKWETCGVCACCDRLVEVNCERQREMGVIVCDQCFREHSIEQKRWSENLTDFRRKPRPLSGSNSHQRSSSGSLTAGSNHFDKVSNNSPLYGRFSSSDSDPFDRIYVSDSSEMVSPEQEAAGEPFYHIAGALSNGESADVHQKEDNRSSTFPRQSVSLEFTNPDEVLYCPYYTRRSRSLDQCPVTAVGEEESNRLSEGEGPNIAVDSSNFQDDESNQQQKVFVKAAYNVSPLVPDCSSSDEEENIRVTETNQQELGGVDVINDHRFNQHGGQHGSYYMMHSDYGMYNGGTSQHSVSELQELRQKSRADESEPIYEDIDQLGLLLETTCAARDDTSDMMDTQPLCTAISKLRKRRSRGAVCDVEKVMIWKEYEAYLVQVKQIGTSACGPTAALNVLRAFDFQVDKEEVVQVIRSNLRMETAPIPYYLFSRYCAGTTADDLVMGIYRLTRGTIRGRFFHFHPHRDVQLLKWLGHWMKKGAVPVATLNLQRGVKPGWTIPDAWHHQMVYGVSSKGVYLTNPLEIVPEHVILEQLSSGSVLLVRRQDVVGRFRDWCPLNEILRQPDPRWRTMNVLGQVVHMLREQCMPLDQLVTMKTQLTSHIRIPVAYKAGISLFMRASSDHLHELMSCPELPVLDKNAGNTS